MVRPSENVPAGLTETAALDAASGPPRIVAVNVGNSRVRVGEVVGTRGGEAVSLPASDPEMTANAIARLAKSEEAGPAAAVVVATVNRPASEAVIQAARPKLACGVFRVGEDLPLPMRGRLDPDATTGQDRVLNAMAAFELLKQAVVVVDAGTALTVDFVDGEGVFQGGAIAPGARMSLHALHEHTSALPDVGLDTPEETPFGKSTREAMLQGVFFAARGLVRLLVERYAEAYGAYPLVVATGGDAELIFGADELVDRVVPDLKLVGISLACASALESEDGEGGPDPDEASS